MDTQRESNTHSSCFIDHFLHILVIDIYARAEKKKWYKSIHYFQEEIVWLDLQRVIQSGSPSSRRHAKIKIKIPALVGRCLFPWWCWACADVYDDLTHAYLPRMPPPTPPLSRWRQRDCLHTAHGAIAWWDPGNKAMWKTGEIHTKMPFCLSATRCHISMWNESKVTGFTVLLVSILYG